MFKLDNAFLTNLGLGSLPVEEKNKLLQTIYERLEMNVGMRLAENMSDQQLDEFESFIDKNDEAGALQWLETNFPDYKKVVAEELEKLKQVVSQDAPKILEASRQDPLNAQQPQAPTANLGGDQQPNYQQPTSAQPQSPEPQQQTPWQTQPQPSQNSDQNQQPPTETPSTGQ